MKFENEFEFTTALGAEVHKAQVLNHWGAWLLYIMAGSIGITGIITVMTGMVGTVYMILPGICVGYILFSISSRRAVYKKRMKEVEELCGKSGSVKIRHKIERDIRTFYGNKKVPQMVTKFDELLTWSRTKHIYVVIKKDNTYLYFHRDGFQLGDEEKFMDFLDSMTKKKSRGKDAGR